MRFCGSKVVFFTNELQLKLKIKRIPLTIINLMGIHFINLRKGKQK